MAPEVQDMPEEWLRTQEGLGVWEGKGKVAAVGVGVSPTARRWDHDPQTSIGALSILAIRRAMEDAGVSPDQVDGLVLVPDTTTGRFDWPPPWPEGMALSAASTKPDGGRGRDRSSSARLSSTATPCLMI